MSAKPRLLVIGPAELRDAVQRLLPHVEVLGAARALDGLWMSGEAPFDAALISTAFGGGTLRAVESVRKVVPNLRVVVSSSPVDEPLARRALERGADDYVIEPLLRDEIERSLKFQAARLTPAAPIATEPSFRELLELGEILRRLDDGPHAVLERLCALVCRAFQAAGASVQVDEYSAAHGDPTEPVLQEAIQRDEAVVGQVALGRCALGPYPAAAAVRLGEYARLIESVLTQARQRCEWRELAWTDDLSGLRNRRYFDLRLAELVQEAAAHRRRLTVLLCDVDDFKAYNDRFGHETGDQLMREVAALLARCTREGDVVCRYGGDEFAVIFHDTEAPRVPGSQHPRDFVALAARFCRAISKHPFECLGHERPGPVTISGGLASYPWDGSTPEQLMHAADAALLEAKRTGKNRIQLCGAKPPESVQPTPCEPDASPP